jgi:hypothetical protein
MKTKDFTIGGLRGPEEAELQSEPIEQGKFYPKVFKSG